MSKILRKSIIGTLVFLYATLPFAVFAGTNPFTKAIKSPGGAGKGGETTVYTVAERAGFDFGGAIFDNAIASIIVSVLSLVGVLFFIYMVYGGYLWMTARGQSEQLEKAKKTITAAIIGIAVTLGAYAVTYFVVSNIQTAAGVS